MKQISAKDDQLQQHGFSLHWFYENKSAFYFVLKILLFERRFLPDENSRGKAAKKFGQRAKICQ